MKTWDDWSDLILSAMVSRACGHKYEIFNDKIAIGFSGDERSGYRVTYFDINDPGDMWPIILDSGISVINLKNTTQWAACSDVEFEKIGMSPDGNDSGISAFFAKHEYYHVNPLRAAAIVFLMINGIDP